MFGRQVEALQKVVARARSEGLLERLRIFVAKGGRRHAAVEPRAEEVQNKIL